MKTYTASEAIAYLRKMQGRKTTLQFAKEMDVSVVLINAVYRGQLPPGRRLGFQKVKASIRYERIQKRAENEAAQAV